jgi:hypothetical protein
MTDAQCRELLAVIAMASQTNAFVSEFQTTPGCEVRRGSGTALIFRRADYTIAAAVISGCAFMNATSLST